MRVRRFQRAAQAGARGAALAGILALGLAGCSSASLRQVASTDDPAASVSTSSEAPAAKPPELSVKDGQTGVEPFDGIKVTSKSKLEDVSLKNEQGHLVDAQYNPEKTEWEVTEPLGYGRTYTLEARNEDGKSASATFSTISPAAQATVAIGPYEGATVGVAQAITFRFGAAIEDTKAAEKAISIETSNDTEGGFFWQSPYELLWRPKEYWQPGTQVTVKANIYGRDFGGGVWGASDADTSFTIGDKVEAVVDNSDKMLRVYKDGELVKAFPVSLGTDGKYDTPNGTYVVGDAYEHLTMDSRTFGLGLNQGGYVTTVDWATQLSYNGIYVHSAPWATWAMGKQNQSHGCVNASPEDAKWFQQYVTRGDPVQVRGALGGTLPGYDGLGYWNYDWEERSGGTADPYAQ